MQTPSIFKSFLSGGFECSTHRDANARRLDLIASTKHDVFAKQDYERLLDIGIATARDGVRWHLIETQPFEYDFSSLDLQVAAARETGIEIIWDIFHYGYPADLDIFSPEFIDRFASFAKAVSHYLNENLPGRLAVCPINEISFFSWIAGDKGLFFPCAKRRGNELKKQLVLATAAATEAIRKVCPDALIVCTDPAIHVVPKDETANARRAASRHRLSQFHALDKLINTDEQSAKPDMIGLNYYFHNQWRHPSRRKIARGHKLYRPFHQILLEFYERYQLPMFVAETGIEDEGRPEWFKYVWEEVQIAIDLGVPMHGICLYPIVNHPGWADDRHCHNGLWDYADSNGDREIYQPLADEVARQTGILNPAA